MFEKHPSRIPNECPVCGATGRVDAGHKPYHGWYNQIEVHLDAVEGCKCFACEEEFFTKAQSEALSRSVKIAARRQLGLLSPDEILAIRRKLGLSQEGLEELLGLGEKVVTRWETGRVVQGKPTDDLLRLMDRLPQVVEELRDMRRRESERR